MRVLVSVASRHGATRGIGERIASVLSAEGMDVISSPPEAVESLDGVDAAVLGSAVYAGHWTGDAKDMIHRESGPLSSIPVWLFSSGPIGDPPKPDEVPVDVGPIMEATGALGHMVFAGKIDRKVLGFAERAVVTAFRVPDGDFRDWDEIERWARGIAEKLSARV